MNDKVQSVLSGILELFQDGSKLPQAIAVIQFPVFDMPMNHWSLLNRLICGVLRGNDYRGFRQWQSVNRFVVKGSKATYIIVPWIKTTKDNGEEKHSLAGFMAKPVFNVEQTEGQQLDYQKLELPDLPLLEKAKEWGVNVKAVSGNSLYNGYYSQSKKEIGLATAEEAIFFHELAHSAQNILNGTLKSGQDPLQEISAELTASALAFIVGKDGSSHLGNHYQYIDSYAKELNLSAHSACLKVISEVSKLINLILGKEENNV